MKLMTMWKKAFSFLKKHKRIVLISLIVLFISIMFFEKLKKIIFMVVFIAVASISKLYHKIIKSTVVIDFVLFVTLLTSLVYDNKLLGYVVGYSSVIISDYLASKLNHHSLVSLLGMTFVVFVSTFLSFLPLTIAMVILVILYEIYASVVYSIMGSPVNQIIIFLISHFISNMIMIFSFAPILSLSMI